MANMNKCTIIYIPLWGMRNNYVYMQVLQERKWSMNQNEKCACREKTTIRSEEDLKKLIHRLNRIEGQIRGIRNMLENDAYCADILTQSAAVNAAVNAFNKELIAEHIKGCVVRDIREGKDEVVDELVVTLQKLMK